MHVSLKENLREVRAGLENVLNSPEMKECPEEVRDHIYSATGHLSRSIQLLTFKYNGLDPNIIIKDGVPYERVTTRDRS
jgi:hypothetical protein